MATLTMTEHARGATLTMAILTMAILTIDILTVTVLTGYILIMTEHARGTTTTLTPAACTSHRMPLYASLSTLGRARRRSISRSAGTPPASDTWAGCSRCAPPRCPDPYLPSGPVPCTLRPAAFWPAPRTACHCMPPVRLSAGRVGVQSAAKLGHLQRHLHAHHVWRALLPACSLIHSCTVGPCPARCVQPGPTWSPPASRLPARTSHRMSLYAPLSTLVSARRRSISRSAGTPPASQK